MPLPTSIRRADQDWAIADVSDLVPGDIWLVGDDVITEEGQHLFYTHSSHRSEAKAREGLKAVRRFFDAADRLSFKDPKWEEKHQRLWERYADDIEEIKKSE
jgi:hypothetical protein